MNEYAFNTQLKIGEKYESVLDKYFSRFFVISEAPIELQKLGVDRIFTNRQNGKVTSVEYKTDFKTDKTGNVFLETVSMDINEKPGWAFTSIAQVLMYYVPGLNTVFIADMLEIKSNIDRYISECGTLSVNNGWYKAAGVALPLDHFRECVISEVEVIDEQNTERII